MPSYLAFVLRSDGSEPTAVPLGPAATIDALVANWRQETIADITRPAGAPRSVPSFHSLGISLRQKIWVPVAEALGDALRIFIVPDGTVNLVPLAALPIERGRYLLESGRVIHHLSAERDLVTDEVSALATGSGLLAVGGPHSMTLRRFASAVKTSPPSAHPCARQIHESIGQLEARTESFPLAGNTISRHALELFEFSINAIQSAPCVPHRGRERGEPVAAVRRRSGAQLSGRSGSDGNERDRAALKRSGPGGGCCTSPRTGSFLATNVLPGSGARAQLGAWPPAAQRHRPDRRAPERRHGANRCPRIRYFSLGWRSQGPTAAPLQVRTKMTASSPPKK